MVTGAKYSASELQRPEINEDQWCDCWGVLLALDLIHSHIPVGSIRFSMTLVQQNNPSRPSRSSEIWPLLSLLHLFLWLSGKFVKVPDLILIVFDRNIRGSCCTLSCGIGSCIHVLINPATEETAAKTFIIWQAAFETSQCVEDWLKTVAPFPVRLSLESETIRNNKVFFFLPFVIPKPRFRSGRWKQAGTRLISGCRSAWKAGLGHRKSFRCWRGNLRVARKRSFPLSLCVLFQ